MIGWIIILGVIAFIGIGIISISFEDDRMKVDFDRDELGNFVDDVKETIPVDVSVSGK